MNKDNIKLMLSVIILLGVLTVIGILIYNKINEYYKLGYQEVVKVEKAEDEENPEDTKEKSDTDKNKERIPESNSEKIVIEKLKKYLESMYTFEEKIEILDKENKENTVYNFEIFSGKDEEIQDDNEYIKQKEKKLKVNNIVGEERNIEELEKDINKIMDILKLEDVFQVINFKTEYDQERQIGEDVFLVKKIAGKVGEKEYTVFIKVKYLVNKKDKPTNRVRNLYITVHEKTDQERLMELEAKKINNTR